MKALHSRLLFLKRLPQSDSGYFVAEILVAIVIVSISIGMMTGAFAQAFSLDRYWREEVSVDREFNRSAGHISLDAVNAEIVTFTGSQPADNVKLEWTDFFGNPRSANYGVSDGVLTRTDGFGNTIRVASRVTGLAASVSGNVLTFTLSIETVSGQSQTRILTPHLGRLSADGS